MTDETPTFFADLTAEAPTPARGIHSQTVSKGDGFELVLFSFAPGEALSEHTSSRAAIIHVLSGSGELSLDGVTHEAQPGTWARMPANCRHAITARSPLVMALYLLPASHAAAG